MKLIYCLAFLFLSATTVLTAQDADPAVATSTELTIDQQIDEALKPVAGFVEDTIFFQIPIGGGHKIPFVLFWLIAGAVFFTVRMGFINLRGFGLAIKVVRGVFTNPKDKGEVSHFQALATALSATVGLGNIGGVAIAIAVGGPGATFWMIAAGILGMSSKFVECTLGVKYRELDAHGVVSGGPMYYLSRGLAKHGKGVGVIGAVLAFIFSIACVMGSFGGGNMFQVNQAYAQFSNMTTNMIGWTIDGWIFGVIMAGAVAVVILGGIRSIAKATEKIVPFMCGIYVLAALIIIGMHIPDIPNVIGQIFSGAFTGEGVVGGVMGVLIQGFRRAAFSNEAGIGSASIAHSAVKTEEPVSEGIVALLEPFIDTVVVCTMTALVIIITNNHLDSTAADGVLLTSRAFDSVISGFDIVLSVAVILFAFSTMISWSYYGLKAWTYLFGAGRVADLSYKLLFLAFVVLGAAMSLGEVIRISDSMIFLMAFPNILGLLFLSGEVRKDLRSYISRIRSGEIPRFK